MKSMTILSPTVVDFIRTWICQIYL